MVKGRQGERVRLYVRGTILGYKRSKSNQYPNTSLIQIEGVNTKEEVAWYQGKRMAYIYKAKVKRDGFALPLHLGKSFQASWELGLGSSCTPATSEAYLAISEGYECQPEIIDVIPGINILFYS
ncbi:ribosomal protein L35Ae family protein [Actinidia rufa]|uniref:Ribosomal protein L35Ae family protein n=1 Tax=Actinidia rufa TaxID=165716 RepID=A0A7J0EB01_9ERIC|nr:ribosomal protein L35Ae family protein [Actinidia rufa]